MNNNEEKTQNFIDTIVSGQLANIETIWYIDYKIETYKNQVTRKISELMATQDIKWAMEDKGGLDLMR